jgi:hypothetical protein
MTDSKYESKKGKDGFIVHTVKKLKKRTENIQRRKKKRIEIVGDQKMTRQNMRGAAANIKAAVTPGVTVAQAKGRQAIKRVGEYRAAKKAKKKPYDTPFAKAVRESKKRK